MMNELDRTEGWSDLSRKETPNENSETFATTLCSLHAESNAKDMKKNLRIV